jgi:hypothetical protein
MSALDGGGVTGYVMYYALASAMVGSTFLVFIYLWKRGRLDSDEEPKYQMMKAEGEVSGRLEDGDGE